VYKEHVVSREDHTFTKRAWDRKESGIAKLEAAYNLLLGICLFRSRTTWTARSQSHTKQSPLSKEVYVIELEKADNALGTTKFNSLASL
jgi:ATP-dependent DNA helicase HFM1/MER3